MSAKSPKPTSTATTTKTAVASPKSAKTSVTASPKKAAASAVKAAPPSPAKPASPTKRAASETTTDVKPKRAATAYFIWMAEVGRADIIAKQFKGDKSKVTEIMKACGAAWSSMSAADKKPFEAKAEKDKARYAKEMESYVPSETSGPAKKKGKKGKKEKDPNKPKRAASAYFLWLNENRSEIIRVDLKGDASKVTEVMKVAGAKWKVMDAKAKEKYEKLAAADKERYAKEMAEYKANKGDDDDDDEEDEE